MDIVRQDSLPSIQMYSLGAPKGPLLYWPRDGFADMPVTLELTRDGVKLADLSHYKWFYMDEQTGLAQHTYQLRAKYGSFTATSSPPLQAGGLDYIGEHLFLLAEPTTASDSSENEITAVLVNTKYKLAAIPSLLFAIEGAPAAVSSLLPNSEPPQWPKGAAQSETDMQFLNFWLPAYHVGGTAFEIAAVPSRLSNELGGTRRGRSCNVTARQHVAFWEPACRSFNPCWSIKLAALDEPNRDFQLLYRRIPQHTFF